jgi:hypothetical protein
MNFLFQYGNIEITSQSRTRPDFLPPVFFRLAAVSPDGNVFSSRADYPLKPPKSMLQNTSRNAILSNGFLASI